MLERLGRHAVKEGLRQEETNDEGYDDDTQQNKQRATRVLGKHDVGKPYAPADDEFRQAHQYDEVATEHVQKGLYIPINRTPRRQQIDIGGDHRNQRKDEPRSQCQAQPD